MKPIKEWSLIWFWWLAIGLAIAATLAENAICSAFGCVLPSWLPTLTEILVGMAVFVLYLQAVVWRLKQGQTDQLRKAWRWWLFFLVGGPLLAAVNVGMIIGFYGPHAKHRFGWDIALRILASFAVLSALLFLISLGVLHVIRRFASA